MKQVSGVCHTDWVTAMLPGRGQKAATWDATAIRTQTRTTSSLVSSVTRRMGTAVNSYKFSNKCKPEKHCKEAACIYWR
jgi:hypothetical protein